MAKADAKKAPSKSEIYASMAESTGLSKKQVGTVLESLSSQIAKSLKKGGDFVIPGLCKIVVIRKPAQKGGQRPNPFKPGEMMEVKPKAARNVVKVRPLKSLKEMA
jgi:DNA-binding protein HU-beta